MRFRFVGSRAGRKLRVLLELRDRKFFCARGNFGSVALSYGAKPMPVGAPSLSRATLRQAGTRSLKPRIMRMHTAINSHRTMTTKYNPSIPLLAAGFAILTLAACSKGERETLSDQAKDAYQDASAKVSEGWDQLKSYTFEKRQELAAEFNAKEAQLEAEISKVRADYSEAEATASRKAAMAELKDAESDYKQKLGALGTATADTWNATRDNVIAAWDRLQASIAKARASG